MTSNRLKCSWCGARKEQTAETKCRPMRDYTDEYTCPMDNVKTDKAGWFVRNLPYEYRTDDADRI